MMFPKREIVESLRELYPVGTRVELVQMNDFQAPPQGTRGTVRGVDDTGSLLVNWDNGSGLNVVYGEDIARKLDSVKVTCYGKTEEWEERKDAMVFYLQAMTECDGSEQERYAMIFAGLYQGLKEVTDTLE